MQRVLIGRIVATGGAVVVVLGTFLPWLKSGTRRRNSYQIFSLVERLGFSRSDLVGWGLRLWPILPLLVVVAVTLLWFPRRWVVGAAVAVATLYAGIVSAAVRSASSNSFIVIENGASVTLIGALILVAGSILAINVPLANRQ